MSLCLFLSEVLRRDHVSVAGCATQVKQARPTTTHPAFTKAKPSIKGGGGEANFQPVWFNSQRTGIL